MKALKVYTTGKIAELLGVAPRTVSAWCESGKMSSYRLPTQARHQHRRVTRESLLKFCRENGLPIEELSL